MCSTHKWLRCRSQSRRAREDEVDLDLASWIKPSDPSNNTHRWTGSPTLSGSPAAWRWGPTSRRIHLSGPPSPGRRSPGLWTHHGQQTLRTDLLQKRRAQSFTAGAFMEKDLTGPDRTWPDRTGPDRTCPLSSLYKILQKKTLKPEILFRLQTKLAIFFLFLSKIITLIIFSRF